MRIDRSRPGPRGPISAAVLAISVCFAVAGFAASAQASTLPTLTLAVTPTSITVGGATQSGAVNVVSTETGAKEAGTILFAMKPGVTVAEVENAIKSGAGKDPNKASKYGSIVFDAEAAPGHGSEAQTYLQPGQYVALEVNGEGGPKAKAPFTVTAAASPAALATPQATIRTIEFGFRGPTTLRDGELVRFENEGYLVHMDIAAAVKSVKAANQLIKLLQKPSSKNTEKQEEKLFSGPPSIFAGPVSSGAYQQETINAKPGVYVELCFMNTQDGREHTQLGMERIIKIAK